MTALLTLAVIHPVLEVLGRHPEFLIARPNPRRDTVMVALMLGIVIPAFAVGVQLLLRRLHRRSAEIAHNILIAALGSLLGFQILRNTIGLDGAARTLLAFIGGLTVWLLLHRSQPLRDIARWGIILPIVPLLLFGFVSPVSRVLLPNESPQAVVASQAASIPVTLIVFDELPTGSLMAGPTTLDHDRFPHLASFAEDAIWYRNATAAADQTTQAIPSLLSGRRAPPGTLPIAADHPTNLFSLLASTHEIRAVEDVTKLCPESLCVSKNDRTTKSLRRLLTDVSLIGAHVVLPDPMTARLPRVDQTWGGFGTAGLISPERTFDRQERVQPVMGEDRRDDLRGVVHPAGSRPPATILHSMLPHIPFTYLPSGQRITYGPIPGIDEKGWRTSDSWLARYAQRRHLLQVGLVDAIVGETLRDLRKAGLYDRGLVIVTADHGVNFQPGEHRREASPKTLASVASVPLFVKYPNRKGGVIDRRPAQTIDIVPTILDVIGSPIPPDIHGESLLKPIPADRSRSIDSMSGQTLSIPPSLDPWEVGRQVRGDFDSGWQGVYHHGPFSELIGRQKNDLPLGIDAGDTAHLRDLDVILKSRAESDPIPAVLTGQLTFERAVELPVFIAVLFEGEVVGIGRTHHHQGNESRFVVLLPPTAFDDGIQRIDLLALKERGGEIGIREITIPLLGEATVMDSELQLDHR